MRDSPSTRDRGAVLITTLIVISVLAVAAAAFMQTTMTDRLTSRSFGSHYRAQLAAAAGLADAASVLRERTASDDFIVLQTEATLANSEFPVSFVGVPADRGIKYFPLFSGGKVMPEDSDGVGIEEKLGPAGLFREDVASDGEKQALEEPQVPPHLTENGNNPVHVGWENLENSDGVVRARYAFWVEDLGGYLDADLAGASPLERADGRSPSELGIYTLFNPTAASAEGVRGPETALIEGRAGDDGTSRLFSTATLAFLGLADGVADGGGYDPSQDDQQYFATGLRYFDEPALVPRGFGFAAAGEPKKNLNDLVKIGGADAVGQISSWIRENLPDFDNRKGGFPSSQDYIKTLAANIVDYADEDNEATVGADYRGVDSYPFITQFFVQIWWVNSLDGVDKPWYKSGSPATWHCKTKVRYHLQVWNPSDKPIDSGTLRVDLTEAGGSPGEKFAFFFDGNEVVPFVPFPEDPEVIMDFAGATLQPNEFRAFSFAEVEYEIDTGLSADFPSPPSGHAPARGPRFAAAGLGVFEDSSAHGYRVFWNDALVDQPGAVTHGQDKIFERRPGTLPRHPATSGEGPAWRGGQPGLRHGYGEGVFAGEQSVPLLGDPRGTFYIAEEVSADRYDQNASWWGRHYIAPVSTSGVKDWFVSEARFASWPDGGHHDAGDRAFSMATVLPSGTGTTALRVKRTMTPETVPVDGRPPIEPEKAPARISNAGEFLSITELGNIYDPLQWRPRWNAGSETTETVETKWRNLGSDPEDPGAMVSDSRYIAPSTLRIGRGEYAPFDKLGQRAAQLLDIFTLDANTPVRGRININTASRDVLRTLGAGIAISSDPRIEPPSLRGAGKLFGPSQEEQGDLLADAIIQSRPFLSPAQLSHAKVEKDGVVTSFFGNRAMWRTGGPDRWLDTAAEEYFRKLFGLVSVRSRNFRIHVTGQALNPDGSVASTVRRAYQVAVEPVRGGDGGITSQNILLLNQKEL